MASATPSLVSKLFFNSELGEQLPYDARRDALNAQPTRRKQHRRPLPGPYGANDAGTFTIAHNRPRGFAQSGFNEVATSPVFSVPPRDLTEASKFRRGGECDSLPDWR